MIKEFILKKKNKRIKKYIFTLFFIEILVYSNCCVCNGFIIV